VDGNEYNDVKDLERTVEENKGDTAAIMLTPHSHDAFRDQELPTGDFVNAVNRLAKEHAFLIALNDVRCGFRIRLEGSARHYGYEADLQCFGKALGNGYPIAVCTGREEIGAAAGKVFFSGTHFFSGVPFAAALDTLDEIEASDTIGRIRTLGETLIRGLQDAADSEGVEVAFSGPPALPFMTFQGDPGFEKGKFFCGGGGPPRHLSPSPPNLVRERSPDGSRYRQDRGGRSRMLLAHLRTLPFLSPSHC
jgi:glutamate-1-semialdehyde 2,1-aminomutase